MFDWFFEGLLFIAAQHHPKCREVGAYHHEYCLPDFDF